MASEGSERIAHQQELDKLHEELTRASEGKQCLVCGTFPRVAWRNGTYVLVCDCATPPILYKPNQIEERRGQMVASQNPPVQQALVKAPEAHEPMTIQEFDERMSLIKHVVGQMTENVHFGIIPGTTDKSLWEAGAEYLRAAFRVAWHYQIIEEREDFKTHDFYYRVKAFTSSAEWEASAWSRERKFWCSKDCPRDCQQDHEPKGMEPRMMHHNVRDRAIKRAFVALIRNYTGTTGYFKQALDIEEGEDQGIKLCPIDGQPLKLNQWGKWSHLTGSKVKGKPQWHNFTPEALAQAQKPSSDTPEGPEMPLQDRKPNNQTRQEPKAPSGAKYEAHSFTLKNTGDLYTYAHARYGLKPEQVNAALGINSYIEIADVMDAKDKIDTLYEGG